MNRPDIKKILAIAGILLFAGVLISLIIHLFLGAEEALILAHLFCLMIIPCIAYGFLILIRRAQKQNGEKNKDQK